MVRMTSSHDVIRYHATSGGVQVRAGRGEVGASGSTSRATSNASTEWVILLTTESQGPAPRARALGDGHISTLLTAAGLTTVHDAGASRGKLVAYQSGDLRHRAYIMIRGAYQALRNAGSVCARRL